VRQTEELERSGVERFAPVELVHLAGYTGRSCELCGVPIAGPAAAAWAPGASVVRLGRAEHATWRTPRRPTCEEVAHPVAQGPRATSRFK